MEDEGEDDLCLTSPPVEGDNLLDRPVSAVLPAHLTGGILVVTVHANVGVDVEGIALSAWGPDSLVCTVVEAVVATARARNTGSSECLSCH